MQYRTFEKTGEKISALGFGAMRLPVQDDGRIDKTKAKVMVDYCLEYGVNYFDTAYNYHDLQSETFLGEALEKVRKDVYLATKLPLVRINKKEDIKTIFIEQQKKLRTDYFDFYLMHAIVSFTQWQRMKEFGVIGFIEEQKKKGAIRNIGFSAHTSADEFKKVLDDYDWDFAQIQYNYLDENVQAGADGVRYAQRKGIPLIVMEPIRGGLLANPRQDIIDIFDKAKEKKSPPAWALKWVWDHDAFLTVLSGMTTLDHVKENIETADQAPPGCLSVDDKNVLEEVKAAYKKKIKVTCTGCGYCMPCPQGVRIPDALECYNQYHMLGEKQAIFSYAFRTMPRGSALDGKASNCIECGICEKKCPQKISIINELKNAAGALETDEMQNIQQKMIAGIKGSAK